MRIVPVLDLMNGQVVRGIAGRRREYRPVVSRLTASSAPRDVARAFADHLGLRELYLADLDAIGGAEPAWGTCAGLREDGFRLWVDAGVRSAGRARQLAAEGVETVVVGLETVAGPDALAEVIQALGARAVFSLDLRDGRPLGELGGWAGAEAWAIASLVVTLGARRLLVLDLARVGVGGGTGTEALCARVAATWPEVELSAGGGVRGPDDLRRLAVCGVRVALVASALHDGALMRADVEALHGP
jgi:phosphoribosylformimino-5-aminoimidazole carboxamide ribotide isomerase